MISKNNKDVVDLEETIVSSANKKTETVIPVNLILIIVYFETNPLHFFKCIFLMLMPTFQNTNVGL